MGLNFLLYFGYEKMVSYLVANNFTSAMSRFARLSEMTTLLYESKMETKRSHKFTFLKGDFYVCEFCLLEGQIRSR